MAFTVRSVCILSIVIFVTAMSAQAIQFFEVNVALNKPAEANDVYSGLGASRAVDGNLSTNWAASGSGSVGQAYWLTVDLGQAYNVNRIVLTGSTTLDYEGYTNVYNLYHSSDETNWSLIGSGTLMDTIDPTDEWWLGGESMRYIQYEVVGGSNVAGLNELQAFATPEPCTLALLTVGAMAALRRRRN